jgi:hypothetical protein
MSSLSRRRALGVGSVALFGGTGCLATESAPGSVDLFSLNQTDVPREVSVRVEERDGRELFRRTLRLDGSDLYNESDVLAGDAFIVTATLADNPFYEVEATFDVRGCRDPRIVVAVEPGPRLTVEREDDDC